MCVCVCEALVLSPRQSSPKSFEKRTEHNQWLSRYTASADETDCFDMVEPNLSADCPRGLLINDGDGLMARNIILPGTVPSFANLSPSILDPIETSLITG